MRSLGNRLGIGLVVALLMAALSSSAFAAAPTVTKDDRAKGMAAAPAAGAVSNG